MSLGFSNEFTLLAKVVSGNCGLVNDGGRGHIAELTRDEKMRRRVPMPVLFYYIVLGSPYHLSICNYFSIIQ